MSVEELKDFDVFYFHGEGDLGTEIASDIQQLVIQPNRSLFYNRNNDSAGVDEYENVPNTLVQQILIPYNVALAISKRNTYVGDGTGNTKDRRVVVSQNTVKFESNQGELDISVFYIPLFNINARENATVKIPTS